MAITYTNRRGRTYYLCRVTSKAGRPRYVFAREPRGEPVAEMPHGFEIRESVNGIVSLARVTPALILPEELAAVEAALRKHPRVHNYRVAVKQKRIIIYGRAGPDANDVLAELARELPMSSRQRQKLRESLAESAQFEPVMRFTLKDEKRRVFHAERWSYVSSFDGWRPLSHWGTAAELAQQLIPTLGTDAFFQLG